MAVEADPANSDGTGTRIQSVSRAARALMLIAALPESERTVANIAKGLSATVPTTYHLLNTLVDAKFLTRDEGKRYQFGVHVGVLAAAYESQTLPPTALVVPLHELITATGETAYLSVWRDGNIEIQAQLTGHHAVQVAKLQPGFHTDAHARASGKVLLAFADSNVRERYFSTHELRRLTGKTITDIDLLRTELENVRTRGYATEEQEFSEGVACVAVPVLSDRYLVGAYTISAPFERYVHSKKDYLKALIAAAEHAIV